MRATPSQAQSARQNLACTTSHKGWAEESDPVTRKTSTNRPALFRVKIPLAATAATSPALCGPEVVLRLAHSSDVPELTSLHFRCFDSSTHVATQLGRRFIQRCYDWYVSAEAAFVVVAEHESKIVGLVAFNQGSYSQVFRSNFASMLFGLLAHPHALAHRGIQRRAWAEVTRTFTAAHSHDFDMRRAGCLALLAVSPEVSGRGIGAGLVRMGIGEGAKRGWALIFTGVHRTNPAVSFYSRAGFVPVPTSYQDDLQTMRLVVARQLTCPPKSDPSAMRVPTGPGWALETLDETDTTHP
jgi:predicted N-acetyltransferase YhbS